MISEIFRNFRDGCCLVINVLLAKSLFAAHKISWFRDSLLNIAQRYTTVNNFFQKILTFFAFIYGPLSPFTTSCVWLKTDHNSSCFLRYNPVVFQYLISARENIYFVFFVKGKWDFFVLVWGGRKCFVSNDSSETQSFSSKPHKKRTVKITVL